MDSISDASARFLSAFLTLCQLFLWKKRGHVLVRVTPSRKALACVVDVLKLLAMLQGMIFVTQVSDELLNHFDTVREVFAMTTGADTNPEKFSHVQPTCPEADPSGLFTSWVRRLPGVKSLVVPKNFSLLVL